MALRQRVVQNPKLPYANIVFAASHKDNKNVSRRKDEKKADPNKIDYWTEEEKERFCEAIELHGRNFFKIMKHVETKNIHKLHMYAGMLQRAIEAYDDHPKKHLLPIL